MALWVAVPCGLAAAVAYGAASAVQHGEAHGPTHDRADGEEHGAVAGPARADPRRLVALLVNPRWLLSVAGDGVGLVLQVIALATGPVVLIQPLLVLSLAVALAVGWALGGPRPDRGAVWSAALIIGALAVFFVLVGDPGAGHPLSVSQAAGLIVTAPVLGLAAVLGVRGRGARVRAVCYGAVAGSGFGLVGVLVNAVATAVDRHGVAVLAHVVGWLPLAGVLGIGAAAMVLTQVSFQIGELSASFPANESAAPLVAVVLGAAQLGERVPVSVPLVVGYLLCLAAIVTGTIRLARAGVSS